MLSNVSYTIGMHLQVKKLVAFTAASLLFVSICNAQRPPRGGRGDQSTAAAEGVSIQWYATLDRGLAEAKRTGKPILFVSAAPHCAGVSGMW